MDFVAEPKGEWNGHRAAYRTGAASYFDRKDIAMPHPHLESRRPSNHNMACEEILNASQHPSLLVQ